MAMAPIAAAKVIVPDLNGVMPKPTCRRSGRRKGVAPTPMPEEKRPDQAHGEGRDRAGATGRGSGWSPGGVNDVGDEQTRRRGAGATRTSGRGSRSRPSVVDPVMNSGEPEAGEGEAERSRSGRARPRGCSGMKSVASTRPRMPTGMLIQKIQRQEK